MPTLKGLVGPSNVLSSALEDCERSINWQVESAQVGTPKAPQWLRPTWGVEIAFTVGSSAMRGAFYQDNRRFWVSGTQFLESFSDNSFTVWGTVTNDSRLAWMCSNGSAGNQLFIVSGLNGYIFNLSTNTLTLIADIDFPQGDASWCEFIGGYFIVGQDSSRTIQWSALEDGTSWDALDTAERSWGSDNIEFGKRNHTDLWLVGTQTSEVWYMTGDVAVFGPAQGSFIERGSNCRDSVARVAQTLIWLDQDERGGGNVVIAKGYQPADISTFAINRIIATGPGRFNDFEAFVSNEEGHVNYWLINAHDPPCDTTLVYDMTEGLWHERAHWVSTDAVWIPHRARCHMFAGDRHFVGDRLTGAVYELSSSFYDDQLANVA